MGGFATSVVITFPLVPSCTCAERAGESMLFMLYKKIFYPRVPVISSEALRVCTRADAQRRLACPSVCVLPYVCFCSCFFFKSNRHLLVSYSSLPVCSQQRRCGHSLEGGAVNARRPSCRSLTTSFTLRRGSLVPPSVWGLP